MIAETLVQPTSLISGETQADAVSDRRADIDAKMTRVADLLQEVGCEGLLLLDPANFAWLTSGAMSRGLGDPSAEPAAYSQWRTSLDHRQQRRFATALRRGSRWPGLSVEGMAVALGPRSIPGRPVPEPQGGLRSSRQRHRQRRPKPMRHLRRRLTGYEQACQLALGQTVAHALEATCRTLSQGESEREIAGHLSHRLIHRGILPLHIGVAVDGRSRLYRRFGFTSAPLERYAVLTVTARKYGVYVTASRSVCFGEPPAEFRQDHNAVCRVSASYLASTWPDAVPREILLAGRRIYLISGYEHEWQLAPQGHLTGRAAVEMPLTPQTEELFQAGWSRHLERQRRRRHQLRHLSHHRGRAENRHADRGLAAQTHSHSGRRVRPPRCVAALIGDRL